MSVFQLKRIIQALGVLRKNASNVECARRFELMPLVSMEPIPLTLPTMKQYVSIVANVPMSALLISLLKDMNMMMLERLSRMKTRLSSSQHHLQSGLLLAKSLE